MNAPVVEKESYSRGRGPRHTAVNRDVTHTVPGSREREIFSNTVLFWFDDLVAHGQKKRLDILGAGRSRGTTRSVVKCWARHPRA